MARADIVEDISFVLFLLPLIIGGAAAVLGTIGASSYDLDVYLAVTRDPLIFSVSVLGVSIGTLFEVYSNPQELRRAKIMVNAKRMQVLAVVTIVVSAIAAWVSLGAEASLPLFLGAFLTARFPLLFAVSLMLLSLGLAIPVQLPPSETKLLLNSASVVFLLISPVALYAGSTSGLPEGIVASLTIILLGLGLGFFAYANKGGIERGWREGQAI